jgi:FtsH-binding integral membrane protein
MADLNTHSYANARTGVDVIDAGLRAYMLRVYNYMAAGLVITGVVAYVLFMLATTNNPAEAVMQVRGSNISLTQFGVVLFTSPLRWVIALAPLGVVILLASRLHTMSLPTAQLTFWIYSALVGASISWIFLRYAHGSITQVFFITAAAFGSLSLYGYTTKKDLSGWGSFLIMGLFGIIIAALVNLFLQSSGLQFAISVIGVLVFSGLTAYDTQQIKEMYFEGDGEAVAGRKAILGALNLYLDFLNLFMMLLSLLGNRE